MSNILIRRSFPRHNLLRSAGRLLRTRQLAATVASLVLMTCLVVPAFAQRDFYENARHVVGRTQEDVRRAADTARKRHREPERIEFALKHLSEFDRGLSRGRFDKDKLDASIDDIKNLVDHNTLEPEDRDGLSADLRDLRELRRDRDR